LTYHAVQAGRVDESSGGTQRSLWDVLSEPTPRVLFKHSPHCITSMGARRRILELSELRPDLPIFELDVIHDYPTSREAEARFGIRHESPQAVLFIDGAPVWHGSHGAVTVEAIVNELDGAAAEMNGECIAAQTLDSSPSSSTSGGLWSK